MELAVELSSKFFSCAIIIFATFYMWTVLLDRKLNLKGFKEIVSFLFVVLVCLLNYYYMNAFIRMFVMVIILSIIIKYLFKINFRNAIITSMYSEFILVISETLFALVITIIFNIGSNQMVETLFTNFFSNVFIAFVSVLIVNLNFIKNFYKFINSITERLNEMHLIVMCLFVIITVNILEATLYYDVDYRYLLMFNTLLMVFCAFIIINSFKTKNNYIKVYDKYNTTLKSLKEYEDILDKYRVSNHENKNQLLTIRNMLPKTSKKIISYIDTIVENKLKDNEKAMFEVSRIPAGGLRGLIYSKVLAMKEVNIEYELEISKDIKTVDLINNIDDFIMLDICKIIGVYTDNAIQEVEKLEEKYINIEMYLDNSDLIISISNNYSGIIELDKIEDSGYTTKEAGHGYGLTLAKQIVDNNKKLSNKKMITQDTFTQMLKIKM